MYFIINIQLHIKKYVVILTKVQIDISKMYDDFRDATQYIG